MRRKVGDSANKPADDEASPSTGYVVLAKGPEDVTADRSRHITSALGLARIEKSRSNNISLIMYYTLINTVVFSIIQWNIFDAYLAFLAKSLGMKYINSAVGVAESIVGLTSLMVAVPIGILVDNYSRTKLLKLSTVVGCIASVVSFIGFYYDKMEPIYANLFMWGLYTQLSCSATEAIFADSIPTGNRSKYFSDKGVIERVSLSLGPGIMVFLFYVIGDTWTLQQLHVPLLFGCVIAPIPCIMLSFFRNPHPEVPFPEAAMSPPTTIKMLIASPVSVRETLTCASPTVYATKESIMDADDPTGELWYQNLTWDEAIIPYLVAFSDFVRKIGAGMTIKFFPLFFINDYGFRPVHISLLFCIYPICMGLATMILQSVSKPLGRAQSALIFQLSGIAFLIGMYHVQNVWLMVIFFVLRGSFQNASFPLDKSIIMDYVPSNRRGIWNAVESITSMTWSGSAVLGGMLSDFHDYRFTFLITASIYLFASAAYLPLLWLVPKNEKDLLKQRRQKAVRRKMVPGSPQALKEEMLPTLTPSTAPLTPVADDLVVVLHTEEQGDESKGDYVEILNDANGRSKGKADLPIAANNK